MSNAISAKSIGSFLQRAQDTAPESSPSIGAPAIESISKQWDERGLKPGDLVLLSSPNSIVLLEQFFGALHAGLVPVLIAPNTPSSRIRELARVFRARAIAGPRLNPSALDVRGQASIATFACCRFETELPSLVRPGEVILLTSGTSGFASGCIFGIEQLLLNAERHARSINQRPEDVVLVSLPMHYSFAMVAQALATFVCGGKLIVDGPPFQASRYERTIAKFGVSISSLTPILIRSLLQLENSVPNGARVLSVGGDSLVPDEVSRLLQHRPGKELYLTYGLSQAGPRVSTLAAHSEPAKRFGSVGRPLEGTTVSLRPLNNSDMKELVVSSATVMRRRIGLVEGRSSTDDSLTGSVATGDLFEQDADGYLYYQGRLSDFIVKNGEKICLAAIRRVASQLPNVVQARIRIIRTQKGEEDFELKLITSAPIEDCMGLLRRQLRQTEIPCDVHIELSDPTTVGAHK